LAHHQGAMKAAIAGNEAEKLRAKLERKEAEAKLENERKEREGQQKAECSQPSFALRRRCRDSKPN